MRLYNASNARRTTMTCSLLFCCFVTFNSCFLHYYKTNTQAVADSATIQQLVAGQKYFILHSRNNTRELTHIKLINDSLQADADNLLVEHLEYLNPKPGSNNEYKVRNKKIIKSEVHLYTKDSTGAEAQLSLPLRNFYRVDVYDENKKATRNNAIFSTIGITVGAVLLLVGVAALALSTWSFNPY